MRWRRGLHRVWQWLEVRALIEHGRELELMHRAMGFATLALVTLAPLLIVVAAADPLALGGFASWLTDGMGLSGKSAHEITDVISPPHSVIGTTSVWGGVLLAVFGVAFGGSVQNAYERIWGLTSGPWHRVWRQATWLVVLTGYLYQEVATKTELYGGQRISLSAVSGVLFFWWGQRFLLGGQVHWRSLLPGAVATVVGLAGLRAFSYLVFTPLIVTNALSYGAVGTVLVVESWLIGVGFVTYGGALFGRWFCEHHWMPSHDDRADGTNRRSGDEEEPD
ncbi:ribonuclease BN [Streptomyces pluripotens]|uniref:Ribonuclease BN n=1 Tax=Streptomyces pluripotens TaxID=1355015 RepID=A0A221NT64_9ACTN|nr:MULTISPECIES: ribonuclease BN [Streptomyces]ARP68760.1 ribonuclease BN [Streptomyces pluripotens]ASN23016.1 ribonuclease BN [Streptomyces pluripotens]MCH0558506.1 ribonuclease BN [Streptomyces sp. MUM 16J]